MLQLQILQERNAMTEKQAMNGALTVHGRGAETVGSQ